MGNSVDWFDYFSVSLNESIVIRVRANPKPNNYIVSLEANCPPAHSDPDRVSWILFANALEVEAAMIWIRFPQFVVLSIESLYTFR